MIVYVLSSIAIVVSLISIVINVRTALRIRASVLRTREIMAETERFR
jgi:hypothetical protein